MFGCDVQARGAVSVVFSWPCKVDSFKSAISEGVASFRAGRDFVSGVSTKIDNNKSINIRAHSMCAYLYLHSSLLVPIRS